MSLYSLPENFPKKEKRPKLGATFKSYEKNSNLKKI